MVKISNIKKELKKINSEDEYYIVYDPIFETISYLDPFEIYEVCYFREDKLHTLCHGNNPDWCDEDQDQTPTIDSIKEDIRKINEKEHNLKYRIK